MRGWAHIAPTFASFEPIDRRPSAPDTVTRMPKPCSNSATAQWLRSGHHPTCARVDTQRHGGRVCGPRSALDECDCFDLHARAAHERDALERCAGRWVLREVLAEYRVHLRQLGEVD